MSGEQNGRTGKGRFAPGTSGNPHGRRGKPAEEKQDSAKAPTDEIKPPITDPRFDVGDLIGHPSMIQPRARLMQGRLPAIRKDDWKNLLTGQGVAGRDKRVGGFFAPIALSFDQLRDLYLGDDLAAVAVDKIPGEAKRPGYDLTITNSGEVDDDAHELAAMVQTELARLGADEKCEEAGKYARAYGGGAILIGANDGQTDLTKPLQIDSVRSVDWLTALEARECIPRFAYGDMRAPNYGKPEIYQLVSRTVLPAWHGNGSSSGTGVATVDVHESRLIIFDGIRVSKYQHTSARAGWGESILTRVWRLLRDFNTAWSSAGVLVSDFAQTVIKMAGLWAALAGDGGGQAFEDRLAAMDLGRSTLNAITIDAADSFERQQTPLTGLPDLLEKFAVRLAAACGMPLTLLFGTSPAGMNATGESDIRFFYDRVDEYRQAKLKPALSKLIQILFRTVGNRREPEKWSIDFRPLWQDSAKDIASTMLTTAQADSAWISAGVLSPDEAAKGHWGQGKFNPQLSVDFKEREELGAPAGAPGADDLAAMGRPDPNAPQQPAADVTAAGHSAQGPGVSLNGAQTESMISVVKAAVMGEIPRESAMAILAVSFPISPEQAEKMLGPAGFKPSAAALAGAEGAPAAAAGIAPAKPGPVPPPKAPPVVPEPRADMADRSKKALLRRLSPTGACAQCSRRDVKLEIDHIDGRDWAPRAYSKTQRAARYWDEYDSGVKLRALCRTCNGSDGARNKQDHPKRNDADWNEEDHPRAENGEFSSGGGSGGGGKDPDARAREARASSDFVAQHYRRLGRAEDEALKGAERPLGGKSTPEGEAAIHEEIKRIHKEQDAAATPEDLERWVTYHQDPRNRPAFGDTFSQEQRHQQTMEMLEASKQTRLEEAAQAAKVKAVTAAGALPAVPNEDAINAEIEKANAEHEKQLDEIHKDVNASQLEALRAVHELDALPLVDPNTGEPVFETPAPDDLDFASVSENLGGDKHSAEDYEKVGDFDGKEDPFENGLPDGVELNEKGDIEITDEHYFEPPELKPNEELLSVDDDGRPEPWSDKIWEANADETGDEDEKEDFRGAYEKAYKSYSERYNKAEAESQKEHEQHQKEVKDFTQAVEDRKTEIKAKAAEAQTKLEALHAKQTAALAALKPIDASRDKAFEDAAGKLPDDDEIVAHVRATAPFQGKDYDEDAGAFKDAATDKLFKDAVEVYSSNVSALHEQLQDKLTRRADDETQQALKDALKGTTKAIKQLSKITGREPAIEAPKKRAPAKRKKSE